MKRWERWTFNLLSLLVTISGVTYFWMKYMLVNDDPFAVTNHAWEPAMLALHVVVSPTLLLMFGIVLNSHIMKKLVAPSRPNRKSGFVSLATFMTMTVTGYLLQVVTGEQALQVLVALHVASGAIFALVYPVHLIISARLGRTQSTRRLRPEAA